MRRINCSVIMACLISISSFMFSASSYAIVLPLSTEIQKHIDNYGQGDNHVWMKKFHRFLMDSPCREMKVCKKSQQVRDICSALPAKTRNHCLSGPLDFCVCVGLKNSLKILIQCHEQKKSCPYIEDMLREDMNTLSNIIKSMD